MKIFSKTSCFEEYFRFEFMGSAYENLMLLATKIFVATEIVKRPPVINSSVLHECSHGIDSGIILTLLW